MTDAFTTGTEDHVAELVGEGKKFKTVADLAKGKIEADTFIEQLKAEQAALRAELSQKVDTEKTLSDLRAELAAMKENNKTPPKSSTVTPSTVSADELKSLVATYVTEAEQKRTSANNIVTANNAIVRHYGSLENAQKALKAKAQELGLSMDDLKTTAAKSPTAFVKLVIPDAKPADVGLNVSSSVNSESLDKTPAGGEPQKGTKEFYDAMRVKNPKQYWSPKIQQEIMAAAQAGTYNHWDGVDRG